MRHRRWLRRHQGADVRRGNGIGVASHRGGDARHPTRKSLPQHVRRSLPCRGKTEEVRSGVPVDQSVSTLRADEVNPLLNAATLGRGENPGGCIIFRIGRADDGEAELWKLPAECP